jgi:hypothetical protein
VAVAARNRTAISERTRFLEALPGLAGFDGDRRETRSRVAYSPEILPRPVRGGVAGLRVA